MAKYKYLKASDGTGLAVLAHIQTNRLAGATVIDVDSVDNFPQEFIATTGTLLPSGFLDPSSITEMRCHLNTGDVIIDSFEPGFTDNGNTNTQVLIIKQTTGWADLVAEYIAKATPAGMIAPFAGAAAPADWLLCDGQAVSRTTYADLFTALGTVYGAGNGSTTFNVPDLRGRSPIGVGTGPMVFTIPAANINTTTDVITVSAAEGKMLYTGQEVVATTSGVMPAPLVSATSYFVIKLSPTTIALATNRSNSVANIANGYAAINLTTAGTGNLILTGTLTARTLAERGGEEAHTQTPFEVGQHYHMTGVGPAAGGYPTANGVVSSGAGADNVAGGRDIAQPGSTTSYRGGPLPSNLMNPYLALNYIIKT